MQRGLHKRSQKMSGSSKIIMDLLLLYDFIQNGDIESLQHYLENCGLDINVVLPCKGVGLLHLAVGIEPEHTSIKCTEILLKHGADPNLCSEEGTTPVHVAAVWGRLAALRLLVACGGDPTRLDDDGRTAFHYAAREQQWPVCDYLRRCNDAAAPWEDGGTAADGAVGREPNERREDLEDGVCSYKLHLERVLVSTGHVVAEYAPVSLDRLRDVSVCRKSEMVREWCEKTTFVVNRLYPTILNQTYQIQDESVPWRPGDFTGDVSTDITADGRVKSQVKSPNETKTSYKSCFSQKISQEELGISGIQVLHETTSEVNSNCDCTCHEAYSKPDVCSRRISVYENFSLPGSPTNITHQNYKSKTSLRKNKSNQAKSILTTNSSKKKSTDKMINTLTSDRSNVLTLDATQQVSEDCDLSKNRSTDKMKNNKPMMTSADQSNVLTSDATEQVSKDSDDYYYVDYRSLNDALAIVQNETNEWLSQSNSSNECDDHLTDVIELDDSDPLAAEAIKLDKSVRMESSYTRIASRHSSGVNSSVSSSSIAIASVQEEYKYEDEDEDVVLIEKRLIIPSVVLAVDEALAAAGSPERSRLSMASSLPASIDYDAERLRAELRACGFNPGPITAATKRLYLRKLKSLKSGPPAAFTPGPGEQGRTYSVELEKSLRNENWSNDLSAYMALESAVRVDFARPERAGAWREGGAKTSFTYLLLDPRATDNLPARAASLSQHAAWATFVNSIFYVGKGKRSRPYSHLYQALTLWRRDFKTSSDKKVQHILDVWSAQAGVVCLHVFQNVIPVEAYTYEAAMIDALGLSNLKNRKSGNYYGVAEGWMPRERRMLGLYLLYRAMLIFLSEGERQLRPGDID